MSVKYTGSENLLMDENNDKFNDECGVFGIWGHDDAAALSALGLHALQHRGQEACGIAVCGGYNAEADFKVHKGAGLVSDNFGSQAVIDSLKGPMAIGHNRYATCGGAGMRNVQPIYADLAFGGFAVAHNGNITNALTLRDKLVREGAIFQSISDTEVIVHLVARSAGGDVVKRFEDAIRAIEGGFSLVALGGGKLLAARDPHGLRPLSLGRLGESYVVASETCAFEIIGAEFVRDVEPGEMLVIDGEGMRSYKPYVSTQSRFCIFEYVYFARPDSVLGERSVYEVRKRIGVELANEAPALDADFVVPVPDSGVPSAMGYAQAAGLPFELGIIRNHYIGRTFIEPSDQIRHLGVKLKHSANRKMIEGKSIVLVDDSIVRGTTSRKIVEMLRNAGAREVHMRIASPPSKHPCFYGIDTPNKDALLANRMSVEEIREHINVDSLAYISLDGLYRALGHAKRDNVLPQYCDACFSGDYPVELVDEMQASNGRRRKISSLKHGL